MPKLLIRRGSGQAVSARTQPRPAAQVTGPQLLLFSDPSEDIAFDLTWPDVRNQGTADGRVSLNVILLADTGLAGDITHLMIAPDGTVGSLLASDAIIEASNVPLVVAPGSSATLSMSFRVPSSVIQAAQDSYLTFNWWVLRMDVWDMDTGAPVGVGDSTWEIRNWFKLAGIQVSNFQAHWASA